MAPKNFPRLNTAIATDKMYMYIFIRGEQTGAFLISGQFFLFDCVDALHPSQQFFSHVGRIPVLLG